MPNHIHAIIHLCQSDVWARRRRAHTHERFGAPVQGSLGTIIRAYKSMVTRRINRLREVKGVSIWQRNYYERVIRNNFELNQIRAYILQNPLQWEHDRYYLPDQARI
jgi:REP element-mobilizing transposase RayT